MKQKQANERDLNVFCVGLEFVAANRISLRVNVRIIWPIAERARLFANNQDTVDEQKGVSADVESRNPLSALLATNVS